MKNRIICGLVLTLLVFSRAGAAKVPEEAKKHMAYGAAALEEAKDEAGFKKAADEFETAKGLAPQWPAPYYNLGVVETKLGDWEGARLNYEKYLKLAPKAKDAEKVKAELYKIEYKKIQKSDLSEFYGQYFQTYGSDSADQSLERQWSLFFDQSGPQSYYMMFVNNKDGSRFWNDHVTFTANDKGLPCNYDAWFDFSHDATMAKAFTIEVKGALHRPGDPTFGMQDRKGKDWIDAIWDCKPQRCYYWFLPENKTWRWSGKTASAPAPAAQAFGGVGMELSFKGELPLVEDVLPGSPALSFGILKGDEILTIDGEKCGALSPKQTVTKLRGPVGTSVTVTLRRAGTEKPVKIKLMRATIHAQ